MENKKFWFFGSKLNTALLVVLIVLMVVALRWMSENRQIYFPEVSKNNDTVEKNVTDKKPVEIQRGSGVITDNIDVINKIKSYYKNGNIDYYIENNLPYQIKGCDSYPIKDNMVNYNYYVKIDTYVADTSVDVYDTNGTKINSCTTYGVNNTTCQNIVSKIDMCRTVFDTAKIFTIPKQ